MKKAYGDTVLFDDLTFTLPPGGIVGVIGPNGAGKTTTFKLITGEEKPDAGTLRLGETVQVGYVDQSRELDPNKSVFDEITGGVDELEMGKKKIASRAYVSWFNFKGAQQQRKVGTLSGGERNRVHLAKLLRKGSNLLLLDEPTNDLDVDTLRALEEALLNYAGCAVVISHDRWFLDRIATHILAFEGDSQTVWFEGNYQDYEADRKRRLGAQADQPHRIKYRKLTRVDTEGGTSVPPEETTMTADQAKFLASGSGQQLQGEWMHTYKAITAVPDAKKDYKPEANSRTAWDLAHHIAICDVGFLHAVAANSFSVFPAKAPSEDDPGRWPTGTSTRCRRRSKRCWRSTAITSAQIVETPWRHEAAVGDLRDVLQQPHDSPPRPADDLSPPDGRQGAGDVRRAASTRRFPS